VRTGFVGGRAADGKLERVVSGTSVAIREGGDSEEDIVGSVDRFVAETVFFVVQGAPEKLDDLRRGERLENVNLGTGKQRRNYLEGRILGGRADKDDVAGFNVREKGILLSFV